jgi:hypothetical protein
MPADPTLPSPSDPVTSQLVQTAKEDLARRLSIPVSGIELIEFRPMVWPDKGLGCPQPGMVYAQVQEEGALIRLRVGKRTYQYHSGSRREPFLCENPVEASGLLPPPGFDK